MKWNELMEAAIDEARGTYAAVKFDETTIQAIEQYIKDNKIPNATATSKLHTTLLISRKYCPDYKPPGKLDAPMVGTNLTLHVWEIKGTDETSTRNCLVVKYKCEKLSRRHERLMDENDATYDFPTFEPHITLSYDMGDMDYKKLPDVATAIKQVVITTEYGEDLNPDFAKSATKE